MVQHLVKFCGDGITALTFRINAGGFFDRGPCGGQWACLQNGGTAIVQLTSPRESPYFSKLDSSFCQIESHGFLDYRHSANGIELALWKRKKKDVPKSDLTGQSSCQPFFEACGVMASSGDLNQIMVDAGECASYAWYI
jgi:hypothetical protein